MNTPQVIVGKIAQRINYNVGKVMKEAGLGKLHNHTIFRIAKLILN